MLIFETGLWVGKGSVLIEGNSLGQNIGFDLLKRVEEDLDGRGSVEQAPLSEGRQLVMLLSPAKTK